MIGGLAGTGSIIGHKYLNSKKPTDNESLVAATRSTASRAIDRYVDNKFKNYGEDLKNQFLKDKGLDTEVGRFNKIFKVNAPQTKELEDLYKEDKNHKIFLPKSSYIPGALGIGTTASLGSYYVANRDKRWRGEDGKIDKKKMAKDLSKAGLAGAGMYAAGKLTEGAIGANTIEKLRKIESGFDTDENGGLPIGKFMNDYGGALKKHQRNVKIGMAGLAAGAGGYALYKYLKRRKREKEEEKNKSDK